jgi:hypothetical protein
VSEGGGGAGSSAFTPASPDGTPASSAEAPALPLDEPEPPVPASAPAFGAVLVPEQLPTERVLQVCPLGTKHPPPSAAGAHIARTRA